MRAKHPPRDAGEASRSQINEAGQWCGQEPETRSRARKQDMCEKCMSYRRASRWRSSPGEGASARVRRLPRPRQSLRPCRPQGHR